MRKKKRVEMSLRDLETKDIELSVGLVLTISQSNWRIGRKKDKLEEQARLTPMPSADDQLFAETFYPLLAAPVISDNCPTVEECLQKLPEADLELWYAACKELNPGWFELLDRISAVIREEEASGMETKKEEILNLISGEKTQVEP